MSSNSDFAFSEAKRERVPLLIGLVGPSGSGKTFSALRLATGIQRVVGGEIYGIDTEARRMLHYADAFRFRHGELVAPFGPSRYLAAVESAVRQGAKTLIIDSASHLHEGIGGVLEMHEAELVRMAGTDYQKRERCKFSAWIKPKQELRRFLNAVLQLPINLLFCLRAKEKMKLKTGQDPKALGFMPIASEELIYEMTVNVLLYPNSGGVPSWHPDEMGEKAIIKLPAHFRDVFAESAPLSEDIGEKLARWAAGEAAPAARGTALSMDQQTVIADELAAHGVTADELKAALKVKTLGEIPASDFERCREWITKKGMAKAAKVAR